MGGTNTADALWFSVCNGWESFAPGWRPLRAEDDEEFEDDDFFDDEEDDEDDYLDDEEEDDDFFDDDEDDDFDDFDDDDDD